MVGLGTLFVAVMTLAMFQMVRRKLYDSRWLQCILMLAFPFPYIATTAGWITAEIGRQPGLIYGLMRRAGGYLGRVSWGKGVFTPVGLPWMVSGLHELISFYYCSDPTTRTYNILHLTDQNC